MEFWQAGEEESYSGQGRESGYSSTRTESSSPQHTTTTREEGGPASLTSQDPSLPSEHLAEEEVARLSGELEWLREETRHGDRKVEELQDQVALLVGENLSLSSNLELEWLREETRHGDRKVEELL